MVVSKRIDQIVLPKGWYKYFVADHVDASKPGIYEWVIEGAGSYIGKYTHISRPTREYQNNVTKLINRRPYRKSKPEHPFRRVHQALLSAHIEGRSITLIILENAVGPQRNARERELIHLRGSLNG